MVLDSAARYQSISVRKTSETLHEVFAWSIFDAGILLETLHRRRERLVMSDIQQLLWLRWKHGYDRLGPQSKELTDFGLVHLENDGVRDILCTRKKPVVCIAIMQSCLIEERQLGFCGSRFVSTHQKAAWWVRAIMQWHSQCVGWSGFFDGFDCFDG